MDIDTMSITYYTVVTDASREILGKRLILVSFEMLLGYCRTLVEVQLKDRHCSGINLIPYSVIKTKGKIYIN